LLVEIWHRAVEATHHFLRPQDRVTTALEVAEFLPRLSVWLAVDEGDRPLGFMGLTGGHIDSLFVDPDHHRKGIGRRFVAHALHGRDWLETEVNEQNEGARGFYSRMGFRPFARTADDGEGRPYPLLHLRLRAGASRCDKQPPRG
jgi:putative acetyltransferase